MRFPASIITVLMGCVLCAPAAPALQPTEYQLKAAYLFHFAQFTEWPTGAFKDDASPFVVTVLGENPFGNALEQTVGSKMLDKHPLVIRQVRSISEAVTNCHVLFISASERRQLSDVLAFTRRASVLTVSEMDGFTRAGGMIGFVTIEKKIRFTINDQAARSVNLKIRSRLLSLAVPEPGPSPAR